MLDFELLSNALATRRASIKILENHVIGNTSSQEGGNIGIHVTGGEVNISDNMEISGNDSAVLIEGSGTTVQMRNNTVFGAVMGVSISSTATDMEISHGNEIYDNTYGIHIQGGNATIQSDNNIHHNDYGIFINTSLGPQIDHNTIENNNDYGIYVYNASLAYLNISWNDVENNTNSVGDDYGIYGTYLAGPSYWYCECNWWGHNSGPLDSSLGPPHHNPDGEGDSVSDYVDYKNWTVIQGGQRYCIGG